MPLSIVFSRTLRAQTLFADKVNRDRLAEVLRNQVILPGSFNVEGGNFFVDHIYSQWPEDALSGEADVLVMSIYSVRPGGLVREETGTSSFTKEDTVSLLAVLKETFPELIWGPWDLPQHNAGYSQGKGSP